MSRTHRLYRECPLSFCLIPTWVTGLFGKLIVIQLVKKLSAFYGLGSFVTACMRVRRLFLAWDRWMPPTSYHPAAVRPILIRVLSRIYSYVFRVVFSLHVFQQKPLCVFRLSHACHLPRPLDRPSFDYLDAVWWGIQITKLRIAKLEAEDWTEGLPNEASCWHGFVFVLLVSSVCYYSSALQAAADGTLGVRLGSVVSSFRFLPSDAVGS